MSESLQNNNKKRNSMKNKLTDLNDHLFAQIERLSDGGLNTESLQNEVSRSTALVNVSDQIIKNADLHLKAVKMAAEYGPVWLEGKVPMIETNKKESPENVDLKIKVVK